MNMNVRKCENNFCVNFCAGLTPAIRENVAKIDVSSIEKQFQDIHVDCNLKHNKALAAMLVYAANILEEASDKFHLPFKFLPPSIRAFDLNEIIEPVEEKCTGFCIAETEEIIKNEQPFLTTSVFLRNNIDNIDFYDSIAEDSYKAGFSASNHFLSKVLHELFHSIHLNHIYEKCGYEGKCNLTRDIYNNGKPIPYGLDRVKRLHEYLPKENEEIISQFLGKYAATSKMELFPEVLTKLTAECIDENTMSLKENPLDKLKSYPAFISKFINGELE